LFKDVGKLACAALCAALATALLRPFVVETMPPLFALAVCGVCFSLVYLGAIMSLGIVSADERDGFARALLYLQRRTHWRRAEGDVV
jgi:hypothetical protein